MPIQEQQHMPKLMSPFSNLQEELHQLDIETFEIEDLITSEQADGALPVQSCNTCFTTSCCSSSCSTI